jgi:CubicO group peptidase (beta-lactamase class C family)
LESHFNAAAVGRILSTITCGGALDGVRLLSANTIEKILQEQSQGVDYVTGQPLRMGIGYGLPRTVEAGVDRAGTADDTWIPKGRVCYWGGMGGPLGIIDIDHGVTFSYVMNKMAMAGMGNSRSIALFRAAYKVLEVDL